MSSSRSHFDSGEESQLNLHLTLESVVLSLTCTVEKSTLLCALTPPYTGEVCDKLSPAFPLPFQPASSTFTFPQTSFNEGGRASPSISEGLSANKHNVPPNVNAGVCLQLGPRSKCQLPCSCIAFWSCRAPAAGRTGICFSSVLNQRARCRVARPLLLCSQQCRRTQSSVRCSCSGTQGHCQRYQ